MWHQLNFSPCIKHPQLYLWLWLRSWNAVCYQHQIPSHKIKELDMLYLGWRFFATHTVRCSNNNNNEFVKSPTNFIYHQHTGHQRLKSIQGHKKNSNQPQFIGTTNPPTVFLQIHHNSTTPDKHCPIFLVQHKHRWGYLNLWAPYNDQGHHIHQTNIVLNLSHVLYPIQPMMFFHRCRYVSTWCGILDLAACSRFTANQRVQCSTVPYSTRYCSSRVSTKAGH
jgi:hypothetical protein